MNTYYYKRIFQMEYKCKKCEATVYGGVFDSKVNTDDEREPFERLCAHCGNSNQYYFSDGKKQKIPYLANSEID